MRTLSDDIAEIINRVIGVRVKFKNPDTGRYKSGKIHSVRSNGAEIKTIENVIVFCRWVDIIL